jgi:sirohydrochlorin ferrochelatase
MTSPGVASFHVASTPAGTQPFRGLLGRDDCASVLQQTLDEEKATDKKLTAMAESRLNRRAA